MQSRALWQFYKDCFPFILGFSLISFAIFGALAGTVILFTIANIIGFLAFSILKRQEFYFYYNLGLTKLKLFLSLCIINLMVAIPLTVLIITFKLLIFGDAKVI